jgi:hypothetical protein
MTPARLTAALALKRSEGDIAALRAQIDFPDLILSQQLADIAWLARRAFRGQFRRATGRPPPRPLGAVRERER